MKTSIAASATLALLGIFALPNYAQQSSGSGANTHALRTSKHYSLPATPGNVQWGWYDPGEKPKLVINSGDTVSIETLSHSLGQIKPGLEMDGIVKQGLSLHLVRFPEAMGDEVHRLSQGGPRIRVAKNSNSSRASSGWVRCAGLSAARAPRRGLSFLAAV